MITYLYFPELGRVLPALDENDALTPAVYAEANRLQSAVRARSARVRLTEDSDGNVFAAWRRPHSRAAVSKS